MNKRDALRLNEVALNILDLVHCLHTGSANQISFKKWKNMFARAKEHEASRKQWQRWKKDLEEHEICERFAEGREDHVVLRKSAAKVAEALRTKAQAILNEGKPERCYPDQVTIGDQTYRLKVYGRAVRVLTDREYAALKASIEEKGRIEVRVVVDRRGNVVDGKHRLMIADELGFEDVPVKVLESEDEEYLQDLAEDLNACRRQFTTPQLAELKRQRQERVRARRAGGMSLRLIAEAEGVGETTIRNDLRGRSESTQGKVTGKDGRARPSSKATKEDVAARRKRVAELQANDEHGDMTIRKIAVVLAVSPGTVQHDVKALEAEATAEQPPPELDPEQARPPEFSIITHSQPGGSWLAVNSESDPLATCLEAAVSGLEQLRERVDEPDLEDLVNSVHGIVDTVLWRLMEGAAGDAAA